MRNHIAKALWTPKFRAKKVKSAKIYSRKNKNKNALDKSFKLD